MRNILVRSNKHNEQSQAKAFFRPKSRSILFRYENSHHFFKSSPTIQSKLTIGQPGDAYEQEADAMADKVVQTINQPQTNHEIPGSQQLVQPKCEACAKDEGLNTKLQMQAEEEPVVQTQAEEEEPVQMQEEQEQVQMQTEEEETVQAQVEDEETLSPKLQAHQGVTTQPDQGLPQTLAQSSGQGFALGESNRHAMEAAFGADFSQVRIHTDARAVQMNQQLGAQAFTHGRDIYFNRGKYNPGTSTGQHLLAHELTHVVQQGQGNTSMINKACLPAASCPSHIPGSASSFGAGEEAREVGPRARRKRMTCTRAISTGHAGRARQLEMILGAKDPTLLARIHGIFIDADMSRGTGAMVGSCSGWISDALPAGCNPPTVTGASKPCVFVHGILNRQAFQFNNSSAPTIGGETREDWHISTLQTLIHEAQHVVFDTSGRAEPPGTAATCPRSRVEAEVTELNAIMSEFPIVIRAIPPNPGPARTRALIRMENWFHHKVTNPHESLAGTLRAMRCECDCPQVNAHVEDIFNFVSSSWSSGEKKEFTMELNKPRWNVSPINLNWPL